MRHAGSVPAERERCGGGLSSSSHPASFSRDTCVQHLYDLMPLHRQVPDSLIPHKTFTGNRPSTSILLPDLSAYTTGQTLAIYENVTAAMVRAFEPANL